MRVFVVLLLLWSAVFAKEYAFLVGLNHNALQGAVNDAKSIKKVLTAKHIDSIIYLYDEQATRKNILTQLSTLIDTLNKCDSLYFFFSGHGTSLFDPSFESYISKDKRLQKLLENSGALIPWDFDSENIVDSIISAKRDLAPLFRKIDKKGAFAMLMIDACFSGTSYKELNFSNELPIAIEPHFGEEAYPYENIIYLASTSSSDWAVEDTSQRPYRGYFSRALEKCLSQHEKLQALKICLEKSEMPQSFVVYPERKDFYLFSHFN